MSNYKYINPFTGLPFIVDKKQQQMYKAISDIVAGEDNNIARSTTTIFEIESELSTTIAVKKEELVIAKSNEDKSSIFAQNITTTQSSSFPSQTTYTMTSAINTNSTSINTTTKLESDVKPISNSSIDMNIVYGILLLFIATICFISYMLINKRKKVQ